MQQRGSFLYLSGAHCVLSTERSDYRRFPGFGRKLATLYDHHLNNSTIIVRKAKRLATLTNDILCLGPIRFKFHDQSLEGKFLAVHIP
jgi:hypothetical protein